MSPELVLETVEKVKLIRERLRVAQDRQRKYADPKCRELVIIPGDHVFIRVSPLKGVFRFGKKGKLAPRYIGPYEVLKKIGAVAYELALPPDFPPVHPMFHVSMLRKYVKDPSHVLKHQAVPLSSDLTFEARPVQVLDRKVRRLRNKEVASIKVVWEHHLPEEATWESESDMRAKYPYLFTT